MPESRRKVVVIGGGIAGLTAAYELSRTDAARARWDVEVVEMGHRYGGRLASTYRPEKWHRNEEHGLHVWFGFYDNTFRLASDVWNDVKKPENCPWTSVWDGLRPMHHSDHAIDTGDGHVLRRLHHGRNADRPGAATSRSWVAQLTGLLDGLRAAMATRQQNMESGASRAGTGPLSRLLWPRPEDESVIRDLERVLGPILSRIARLSVPSSASGRRRAGMLVGALVARVHTVSVSIAKRSAKGDPAGLSMVHWVDLALAALRGICAPEYGILEDGDLDRISKFELREFLRKHGASEESLESATIDSVYDMPFAYRDGDRAKPVLEASTALRFTIRIMYGYKHGIAYLLKAGAGETLVAPLYALLRERGVVFRPFQRLQSLELSDDGTSVQALHWIHGARPKATYDPLVTRDGLLGFRADPDWDQLEDGAKLREQGANFYSRFGNRGEQGRSIMERGRDFDDVIVALPLGSVAQDGDGFSPVQAWLDAYPGAKRCLEHLHLVPTVAAQIWLDEDPASNNLLDRTVVTWAKPYSVICDMSPVIEYEGWPKPRPKTSAYLCGAWPLKAPTAPSHDATVLQGDTEVAKAELDRVLQTHGRDWFGGPEALHKVAGESDPYAAQYIRANVEPWDLADLALPGADRYRLEAADSGLVNMALAGAWVRTHVNTTSLEAAVSSGIAAARALGCETQEIFGESFLRQPSRNPRLPGRQPAEPTNEHSPGPVSAQALSSLIRRVTSSSKPAAR